MPTFNVLENRQLSEHTFCLKTERPSDTIVAGQCFNVGVPGSGVNREYSMYSDANAPHLEFLIRQVEDGTVSPALAAVRPGDPVEIDGPYGEFTLKTPDDDSLHYLFICTGTGIAPFHSFVATYTDIRYQILHGVRHEDEQYDAAHYPAGAYTSVLSRGPNPQRVTDYLISHTVDPDTIIYLCGNRSMIIDVFAILRDAGVPGDNLFTEVFF